jgi:hypothetical protein
MRTTGGSPPGDGGSWADAAVLGPALSSRATIFITGAGGASVGRSIGLGTIIGARLGRTGPMGVAAALTTLAMGGAAGAGIGAGAGAGTSGAGVGASTAAAAGGAVGLSPGAFALAVPGTCASTPSTFRSAAVGGTMGAVAGWATMAAGTAAGVGEPLKANQRPAAINRIATLAPMATGSFDLGTSKSRSSRAGAYSSSLISRPSLSREGCTGLEGGGADRTLTTTGAAGAFGFGAARLSSWAAA